MSKREMIEKRIEENIDNINTYLEKCGDNALVENVREAVHYAAAGDKANMRFYISLIGPSLFIEEDVLISGIEEIYDLSEQLHEMSRI